MGYYGFGFGGIFMWLFWGLIIWAVFGGIRGGCWHGGYSFGHNHGNDRGNHDNKSLAILNERYAKGEISKEEYEEKKKALLNG